MLRYPLGEITGENTGEITGENLAGGI